MTMNCVVTVIGLIGIYAIEFTFAETTNAFTIEKTADGKSSFYKDNRKLIQAILYKNGLEVCHSAK